MSRPGLLQGDVVMLDGRPHVIVSRSCDLPRTDPERVVVAPVVESDAATDERGWNVRRVRIPALARKYAEMSAATSVLKDELPERAQVRGCPDEAAVRQFREDAGRFLSVSSLPKGVNNTVDPLWQHMKTKRNKPGYEPMIGAILDIRVRFHPECAPDDEESPRTMTLIFVADEAVIGELPDVPPAVPKDLGEARDRWLDAKTMEQRASVLDGYCQLLGQRCAPQGPVAELEVEVVTNVTFTYADYLASDPIRVEAVSV